MTLILSWVTSLTGCARISNLSENASVALRAARAGVCAARLARGTQVAQKADDSRVSSADYAAQAAVIRELPHDAYVIAEECGNAASDYALSSAADTLDVTVNELRELLDDRRGNGSLWWVDPIDGTEGFLRGASWAVGVAMCHGPAALALPARDIILIADETLWIANVDGDEIYRNNTSLATDLNRWHFSPAGRENSVQGIPTPERLCCGSLVKYGEVALSASAALVQAVPLGIVPAWDHAAGVAVVLSAGGTVTDIKGSPVQFDGSATLKVESKAFVATAPGANHEQWLDFALESLHPK